MSDRHGSRPTPLNHAAVWGISLLAGVIGLVALMFVVPSVFGWADLDSLSDEVLRRGFAYVLLHVVAGTGSLIALIPALRGGGLIWHYVAVLFGAVSSLGIAACIVALYRLGTTCRWRVVAVGATLALVGGAADILMDPSIPSPTWSVTPWIVLLLAVALGVPLAAGSVSGYRRITRQRVHDARMHSARVAERSSISRDIHDSLSHRLSLITINAGAVEYRDDLAPEQIKAAVGTIREQADAAHAELREILSVLRSSAPIDPRFTIPELVSDARDAGMHVDLTGDVPEHRLSTLARHAVHRTLQEALTNARKHAPGAHVEVEVIAGVDTLTMIIRNPLAAHQVSETEGQGYGLEGLKERAELAGGELNVYSRNGIFTLSVEVPWSR